MRGNTTTYSQDGRWRLYCCKENNIDEVTYSQFAGVSTYNRELENFQIPPVQLQSVSGVVFFDMTATSE